jgi:sporulation protein YlmC with PRC-barrel domain
MTTQKICLRSDILGTQVITRDTGKRLGVVSQLWVDIDQREVVALSLRENLLSNLVSDIPRYMMLDMICQIGDVILVDDESAIEDVDITPFSKLIRAEVITESGELLGRVHSYLFDIDDGKVTSLIISSLGLAQIPDKLISTYELPVTEIVSTGPDRIIVFEGAEDRISQLTVGVLESLGLGKPPWEHDDEESYRPTVIKTENQLGTGVPVKAASQVNLKASQSKTWDEHDWEDQEARQPLPPVQSKRATPANDDSNWSDSDGDYQDYEEVSYVEPQVAPKKAAYLDEPEDLWGETNEQRPQVNIPSPIKVPEYEEENT